MFHGIDKMHLQMHVFTWFSLRYILQNKALKALVCHIQVLATKTACFKQKKVWHESSSIQPQPLLLLHRLIIQHWLHSMKLTQHLKKYLRKVVFPAPIFQGRTEIELPTENSHLLTSKVDINSKCIGWIGHCSTDDRSNLGCWQMDHLHTPWKINGWNLQPSPMKRKEHDLNQTSMIMYQPLIFRGVHLTRHQHTMRLYTEIKCDNRNQERSFVMVQCLRPIWTMIRTIPSLDSHGNKYVIYIYHISIP